MLVLWLPWWSCAGPDADDRTTGDGPPDSTADVTGHSGGTACSEAVSVAAAPGVVANQVVLTVTTSVAGGVAARCVADDDPGEVVLAEDPTAATTHELRLGGLLPGVPYTCRAAAPCGSGGVASSDVAFLTQPAATPLPTLTVEVDPTLGATGYWTLAPWLVEGCRQFQSSVWLGLWDAEGRPRWWWPLPPGVYTDVEVLLDPSTGLVGWGGGGDPAGNYRELDPLRGEVYAAMLPPWEGNEFSHDAKRLDPDRVLTLQVVPNRAGNRQWDGFGIRVHDPADDSVLFQVDSQRYVDEGLLREGRLVPADVDPYHANWVDLTEGPRGPELYASLCFLRRLVAIDADDGALLWQLGEGLGWTVLDEGGAPLPDSELPQCTHGLEVRGDRFLVYDNGQVRQESRASEWRIDPDTLTAQRTWNWTEPGWYEPFVGDIDDLGNGRLLVTQATNGCETAGVRITEVDRASGRVASRMRFPLPSHGSYRAQRYEGCALLPNARSCPAVADRLEALAGAFGN
jgi:hypothetical protein